ncbi:MAG: AMP-binding protein, partial [Prevotellaceae bacterium]|nr:AMP-binding protein [Prevotellaceae bacterium]
MFLDVTDNKFATDLAIITDKNEHLTWRELFILSDELYAKIGKPCLVFCLCQNSIPALTGYVSFISHKIVPLLLDASLNKTFLKNLITVYRPEFLWLPTEKTVELTGKIVYTLNDYSLLQLNGNIPSKLHKDLALLLTTSGSTGSPKLVRLSYDNIISNAKAIAEYLNINNHERPVTSLPMHYSYGLSVINSHLIKGATVLLTDKPVVQKEFWNFVKEQKATSIAGVPYTYEMLKRLHIFRMDLPALKTMTQAGGKLNAELAKEYMEQAKTVGKRFIVMYGQTEATARMSYLPFDDSTEKYGSIGIAIPGG